MHQVVEYSMFNRDSTCPSKGRPSMHGTLLLVFVVIIVAAPMARAGSHELRVGWKFLRGDSTSAHEVELDDSQWQAVRLPHDWAISGPFQSSLDGGSGKLPWRGVGWYRTSFELDSHAGTRVYLDFDGVMAFPAVYINGQLAGKWDYGYTPFRIDATPYLNRNGRNVVAVRVDTTSHGTRWYPGAGIYRKVKLEVREPIHFAQWGIQITTPKVTDQSAEVEVRATIENHLDEPVSIEVAFDLNTPEAVAQPPATATQQVVLQPGTNEIEATIHVDKPRRWDVARPNLYTLRSVIKQDDAAIDVAATRFGIRTMRFTADDGFHLNGRRVQLYGVNLHHDLGPLGAAFNTRAVQRQLEIMRDMGANAIRTGHNPPAAELLDMCDEMGFLVWDECFDKWNETADRIDGKPSLEEHAERHLRSMVLRDRNHPSVVAWSIGNEIAADEEGVTPERVKMMCDVVRKYDTTRPVGMGCHIPHYSDGKILDALDLAGWNYGRRYDRYRERYPDRPIVYTESASALSSRGFYDLPLAKTKTDYSSQFQVDSYDLNAAPWSDVADVEFKLMEDDRFVAGEFVWTGFDYLGEPTPFEGQAKNSYFGIVDLCGIPKDRYYLYRSHWRPEFPTVHIVPHWNWPDRMGQTVPVFVYTNGDSAELFLNGQSLGVQRKGTLPQRPINLASGRPVSASSSAPNHAPQDGADDSNGTRWCAIDDDMEPWWQVDLGQEQPLQCLIVDFHQEAKHYGYLIQTSTNGVNWESQVEAQSSEEPRWGGPRTAVHDTNVRARYVRIVFTEFPREGGVSMHEFAAYSEPTEASYYSPTYEYRLRWNNVVYKPGELTAIAYKNGSEIGKASVRTVGPAAALRLSPDRSQLAASGEDLSFVLVEAVDENGDTCPLADNLVRFRIEGPADIAAVGNGNPLSLEPFQADARKLFAGKAMLILRTLDGEVGDIRIAASADGLTDGTALLRATSAQ